MFNVGCKGWHIISGNSWLFDLPVSILKVTKEKVHTKINKDKKKSRISKGEKEGGKKESNIEGRTTVKEGEIEDRRKKLEKTNCFSGLKCKY
jgi:hypothetical protein